MPHVIVECGFDPPFTPEAIEPQIADLRKCLIVREAKVLTVYAAENGKRLLFVLEARDAESVRNAFRSAGVPFERAWLAVSRSP